MGLTPAQPRVSHVLYLHGFRSSPQSAKARHVQAWIHATRADIVWCCPQLPPSPAAAMALMEQLTRDWPQAGTLVIGSSLGGFYAAAMAVRKGWRSLLLNPAVHPGRDLARYIGDNTAWHAPEEHFHFKPEYIDELNVIESETLALEQKRQADSTHAPAWALICEGDEVLDWHEMTARHAHATQTVLPGNDHAISDFPVHWPRLARQIGLLEGDSKPHP